MFNKLPVNLEVEANFVGSARNADGTLSVNVHLLETETSLALITVRQGERKTLVLKDTMAGLSAYLGQYAHMGLVWKNGDYYPEIAKTVKHALAGVCTITAVN